MKTTALRWMAVGALLLGTACTNPKNSCKTDSDCDGVGGVCDTSIGQCVARPDFCPTPCAAYEQCVNNACSARYTGITITAPQSGALLRGGTDVTASLNLGTDRQAEGPERSSLLLTWTGLDGGSSDAGTMALVSPGSGMYRGQFLPVGDGDYRITVSYPAAAANLSASTTVSVDTTPPQFALMVPSPTRQGQMDGGANDTDPAAPNAWRRDETVQITAVSPSTDVDPSTVQVMVMGVGDGGTVIALQNPAACDAGTFCQNYKLQMWDPQLQAFRGVFAIALNGSDKAGNTATADSGVPVTRWKWDYNVGSAAAVTASPAIGSLGRVYLATTAGKIVGVNPRGSVEWTVSTSPINASPAIGAMSQGREVVYYGTSGNTGQLFAIDGNDGGMIDSCGLGDSRGALAVDVTTVGTQSAESVLGVLNSATPNAQQLVAFRPGASAKCQILYGPPNIGTQSSVVTKAGDIYYGDAVGKVQAFHFATNGNWATKAGWPSNPAVAARALALADGGVFGGGSTGLGGGGVFSLDEVDGGIRWKWAGSDTWNPVVNADESVTIGVSDSTLKTVMSADDAGVSQPTLGGVVQSAPVLGQGGLVYTASNGGAIQAWRGGGLIPEWSFDNPTVLGTLEASVSIDCARDSSGTAISAPGVLYVASDNGHLFAFIVDSHGLDTTAPWPKYQHDPRNTGNALTPLTPCP